MASYPAQMRIEYVALILEKDGRFLVERRKSSKRVHAGKVVFPAGKIESGESNIEALLREMKEELGINIHNPHLVCMDDYDGEEQQRIYWYRCESYDGEIQNNEAEELIWIGPDEAQLLTFQNSRDALSEYLNHNT